MSWIAEYDTQGREFPTCVHVTKTTGTMTHGATYVPIEDGKAVRAENAKLRKLLRGWQVYAIDNTFGDIYKSEDVVDSNVVTFCDKHGYRLYTSMEVYGLLHDPNANERILTHDELPKTIPCSEVFADIDV